jgi:hypothetical protein
LHQPLLRRAHRTVAGPSGRLTAVRT